MCDTTNSTTQSIADYLSQLLKDRKQLAAFPNVFIHVERLLDEGELHTHYVYLLLHAGVRALGVLRVCLCVCVCGAVIVWLG